MVPKSQRPELLMSSGPVPELPGVPDKLQLVTLGELGFWGMKIIKAFGVCTRWSYRRLSPSVESPVSKTRLSSIVILDSLTFVQSVGESNLMPSEEQEDLAVGSELFLILAQDAIHLFWFDIIDLWATMILKKHTSNTTTSRRLSPRWKFAKSYLNLTGVALSAFFFSVIVDTSGKPGHDASWVWWPSIAVGGPVQSQHHCNFDPNFGMQMTFSFAWWSIEEDWDCGITVSFWGEENKTHIEWWFMCLCGTWDDTYWAK